MDVCFVTTAKTDEEGKELLKALALRSLPRITKEEIDTMAKLSMKLKQSRPAKFSTRAYTRCRICGRPHSVLRKYGVCRVCFRELAYKGEIPGVKKASW